MAPVSGHIYRVEGKRRPVWRAKYRLPDGRQVNRTIGPAWTERGRPPAGYYTKRTAEAWLREVLAQARAGTLPGMVRTGVTLADACEESAAFTGLRRGGLVALRWRDVDFAASPVRVTGSFAGGRLGDDDLVFPGVAGGYLDASALARRYKAALRRASLRPLRFHDLRPHVWDADDRRGRYSPRQEWMGLAYISPTMRYLHYVERPNEVALVAGAFVISPAPSRSQIVT